MRILEEQVESLKGFACSPVLVNRAAMSDEPATRPSLLLRLRDPRDAAAWSQFVDVYAPLVYGFGRRQGLQDADAADLTQEVLRAVAVAAGRLQYDPERGSFRGWLFTIARNKLRNFLAMRQREVQGSGDTAVQQQLQEQPDPAESALWDREYDQRLFTWAAEQVRGGFHDATWKAFWQTAVEGKKAAQVAAALGISVGAVYIARSRVLARLRQQIQQLESE
jgi:RNA polymerase sigma factor (sigma-70 family)